MKEKEHFEDWLRKSLTEGSKGVFFSEEKRENVRRKLQDQIQHQKIRVSETMKPISPIRWWNRRVVLSFPVIAFCLALLFIPTFMYTRSFFHISPQELAQREQRQRFVFTNSGVPFGAVQSEIVASARKAGREGRS